MKRFRFSLEAVLTVRQRAEREALASYAESLLARERALERLAVLHHELSATWTHLRQELAAGCAAGRLDQLRHYCRGLEEELTRREEAVGHAERAVNHALRKMLSARQQREVVDKFRDQQRAQYDRKLTRENQKFLDELASQRAAAALARRTAERHLK